MILPTSRLKRSLHLCLCSHGVFTRMIRGWQVSPHLTQSLTLKPLQAALHQSVCEIHHSDQGVQYLSNAYLSTLKHHGIEISLAHRGRPWENGYAERLIRTLKEEEVHLNDYDDDHPSKSPDRAFYHTGVSPKTPILGVRKPFDTYGISAKKLVLTLGNFGPNKWWHYNLYRIKTEFLKTRVFFYMFQIPRELKGKYFQGQEGKAPAGRNVYRNAIRTEGISPSGAKCVSLEKIVQSLVNFTGQTTNCENVSYFESQRCKTTKRVEVFW